MLSKLYERAVAREGQFTSSSPAARYDLFYLIVASILVAGIYVGSRGSVFTAISLIGAVAAVVLTFYRVDWGFMFFIGCVLLFDQFPPRGYERTIIGVEYFYNLKSLSAFAGVGPAVVNPLELHLFIVFIAWIFLIITGKKLFLSRVGGWASALIFFLWLTLGAITGIGRGGDFLPALWEIRALFYLGIMFVFVPQIIQTRPQVVQLFWVIIIALSFKTLQGLARAVNLGFHFGGRNELTNHEDPLFFTSLVILLSAFFVYKYRGYQRRYLMLLFSPMMLVFFLSQRRATWAALAASMLALLVLIEPGLRKKLVRMVTPFLVIIGVYLAIFWDTPPGGIGHGAFLVRSSFGSTKEEAGERYYSNLYREFEDYNLAQTVKTAPLFGIGFGNKYEQPIKLPRIPFTLAEYIPHNEILWLYVKVGSIGFFLFWIFFYSHVVRAASLFTKMRDPYMKSVCAVTIIAVLGQVIVSFYDLQLTYYRNMIFLGLLMGLVPTLSRLQAQEEVLLTSTN